MKSSCGFWRQFVWAGAAMMLMLFTIYGWFVRSLKWHNCDMMCYMIPIVLLALSWVLAAIGGRRLVSVSVLLITAFVTMVGAILVVPGPFEGSHDPRWRCWEGSGWIGWVALGVLAALQLWLAHRAARKHALDGCGFWRQLVWAVAMVLLVAGALMVVSYLWDVSRHCRGAIGVMLTAIPLMGSWIGAWIGGCHLLSPSILIMAGWGAVLLALWTMGNYPGILAAGNHVQCWYNRPIAVGASLVLLAVVFAFHFWQAYRSCRATA